MSRAATIGAPENPYDSRRIGRSAGHFLLGKGVTSIAGIGTLLLVIRGLDRSEFAAYSILFGLVELCIAVTNVGTGQILSRYVPEIFSQGFRHVLWRLVLVLLAIRYVVLGLVLLIAWQFVPQVSGWIGLEQWQASFRLYLWVVLFRAVVLTVFQVLEAMLLQGSAQTGMSLITVSRFLLVLGAYSTNYLDLDRLIQIEVVTDAIGACALAWILYRAIRPRGDQRLDSDESRWLEANRGRMLNFGMKGYLQHLIIMPYSGVVNRLVLGGGLSAANMAIFGVAQSVFDLMQRFLPAQLFLGLIRPVMAARFSQNGGFGEVMMLTNLIFKVNLFCIGFCTVVLVSAGGDLLRFLSNDKYGDEVLLLLLLMQALICLESWRHVVDVMSHTVERYGVFIYANAVLGSSLLLGVGLMPWLGFYALPAANCVGILAGVPIVIWWLGRTGFEFRHDWRGIGALVLAVAITAALAWGLGRLQVGWGWRMVFCVLAYLLLCVLTFRSRGIERAFLEQTFSMVKQRIRPSGRSAA